MGIGIDARTGEMVKNSTEKGFQMDDEKEGVVTITDARTVITVITRIVEEYEKRLDTRKNLLKEASREEQSVKDSIRRRLKKNRNDLKLNEQLEEAQKALDEKRKAARESHEYKALLNPSEMETIEGGTSSDRNV